MKPKKKRCANCRQWFNPDPRSFLRENQLYQRYCSKLICCKSSKKESQAKWLGKNRDYFKGEVHKRDCRRWVSKHPGYWRGYRRLHPDYVEANRQTQKIRDQRRCILAKKDEIAQNPVGHLESIRTLAHKNLAKKDEMRIPVERILDFLVVRETLAKKDMIAMDSVVVG